MSQKKYNFDIDVQANTYAGDLAMPYVTAAINGADTIAKGRARLIEGVTRKAVINNIVSTNPIQAASCSPSDGSNTSLSEQVLTLNDCQVYEVICRKTIFPTWVAAQGNMRRNGDLPPAFSDFLLATVAAKAGEQLERLMWVGDANPDPDTSIWGLGLLSNDGTIDEDGIDASAMAGFVEADTGATAWAKGNILDIFALVYDAAAANPALFQRPGAGFYCSYEAFGFYLQALAEAGSDQGVNMKGTDQAFSGVTYLGYPVYPTYGIPNDKDVMVFTYPENVVVGTNNYTGDTSADLIPTYQYDGKDSVVVTMNFAAGVQVGVPTDGVVGFNFT
jgi:hypothetical protein